MQLRWMLLFLTVFLSSCQGQDTKTMSIQNEMAMLLNEIDQATSDKSCNITSDCDVLEFGSQPCGTITQRVVYAKNNVDLSLILSKSQRYTELEKIAVQGLIGCSLYVQTQFECNNLICKEK